MLCHLVSSGNRFLDFYLALEEKRYSNYAYGKKPALLSHTCHHRGGSGTGASTHTGGDKHHFGIIVKQAAYLLSGILGKHFCLLRLVARPESVADTQCIGDIGMTQCLLVGIYIDKRDVLYTFLEHVAYSVVTAAAHSDSLDYNRILYRYPACIGECRCIVKVLIYIVVFHLYVKFINTFYYYSSSSSSLKLLEIALATLSRILS